MLEEVCYRNAPPAFQSDGMVTRSGVFRGVVKEVLPPVRLSGGGVISSLLRMCK